MSTRDDLRLAARTLAKNETVAAEVLACPHASDAQIHAARRLVELSQECLADAVSRYLRQVSLVGVGG